MLLKLGFLDFTFLKQVEETHPGHINPQPCWCPHFIFMIRTILNTTCNPGPYHSLKEHCTKFSSFYTHTKKNNAYKCKFHENFLSCYSDLATLEDFKGRLKQEPKT